MNSLAALVLGFGLDLCLGDPPRMPHPVVAMGRLITLLEGLLRRLFPPGPRGELAAGALLALLLPSLSFYLSYSLLALAARFHPLLCLAAESWMCYHLLALRGLAQAGRAVYEPLSRGELEPARAAVSRVVGRDTQPLDGAGITRAAVETVAENAADGVVAPLLFMALGGAPLGMAYKAVNTMDSMVGYRNERYLHFGRPAARLDDLLNFLPARLCALLMIPGAALCGLDWQGAWRVLQRDGRRSSSPNAGRPEAACAGALGVWLLGDAWYFGRLCPKQVIGQGLGPARPAHILSAVRLLYATSLLCLSLLFMLKLSIILLGV